MDRTFDKSIVLIACMAALLFTPFSTLFVVAFLLAIVVAFISEIRSVPPRASVIGIGIYLVCSLVIPEFAIFIPLVSYDFLRKDSWFYRLIWLIPFFLGLRFFSIWGTFFFLGVAAIMVFLSQRTLKIERDIGRYIELRDELREESLALEQKKSRSP